MVGPTTREGRYRRVPLRFAAQVARLAARRSCEGYLFMLRRRVNISVRWDALNDRESGGSSRGCADKGC